MKASDKILVAFLVSMGMFTGIQAKQYVCSISSKTKKQLMSVYKVSGDRIAVCVGMAAADEASETAHNKKA